MNTPNNKRKRNSQEKIEKVFIQLIQKKNITEISVSTICEKANINRSTFYANYLDIYDLGILSIDLKISTHTGDISLLILHIRPNT